MSGVDFNVRSLSDPSLVRRKSNDLDSKHKEKPYEKKKKRKKDKQVLQTQQEIPESENEDSEKTGKKPHRVDVFI